MGQMHLVQDTVWLQVWMCQVSHTIIPETIILGKYFDLIKDTNDLLSKIILLDFIWKPKISWSSGSIGLLNVQKYSQITWFFGS